MPGTDVMIGLGRPVTEHSGPEADVENLQAALAGESIDRQKLATSLANVTERLVKLRARSDLFAAVQLSEYVDRLSSAPGKT